MIIDNLFGWKCWRAVFFKYKKYRQLDGAEKASTELFFGTGECKKARPVVNFVIKIYYRAELAKIVEL